MNNLLYGCKVAYMKIISRKVLLVLLSNVLFLSPILPYITLHLKRSSIPDLSKKKYFMCYISSFWSSEHHEIKDTAMTGDIPAKNNSL